MNFKKYLILISLLLVLLVGMSCVSANEDTINSNGLIPFEPIPLPGGDGNGSSEAGNITLQLENITYGEQGKCTVYLSQNASGVVYFYISDTMTSTIVMNSNKVVFTYLARLDAGTYEVLVKVQDNNCNFTPATGSFNVYPKNIDFNVTFDELFTGYEITGTVDNGGIPGILRLSLYPGTLSYRCHIDEDGEFTFTSDNWPFWANEYNRAQMFFDSDDNNYEGIEDVSLIINPIDIDILIDDVSGKAGSNVTIEAILTDANGNPVQSGVLLINIDNKEYSAFVEDGVATFEVILPSEGDYICSARFEDTALEPSYLNATTQFTVISTADPQPDPKPTPEENSTNPVDNPVSTMPNTGNPILVLLISLAAVGLGSLRRKF